MLAGTRHDVGLEGLARRDQSGRTASSQIHVNRSTGLIGQIGDAQGGRLAPAESLGQVCDQDLVRGMPYPP